MAYFKPKPRSRTPAVRSYRIGYIRPDEYKMLDEFGRYNIRQNRLTGQNPVKWALTHLVKEVVENDIVIPLARGGHTTKIACTIPHDVWLKVVGYMDGELS